MSTVNIFSPFTSFDIGAVINRIPNPFGRINQLGIFPFQGITTNTVAIEEMGGSLALIQTEQNQGPGRVGQTPRRKLRTFAIPRLVDDQHVSAQEVQNVRAFGDNTLMPASQLLSQKLATARAKHDQTLEHLRMGALKGVILDADGSTLFNLYNEFGITQATVDFTLGTASSPISDKCREVVDRITEQATGETMSNVHALVSREFFTRLIQHANVTKHYLNWMNSQAAAMLGAAAVNTFPFAGVTFEVYNAVVADADGQARRFIAANEGHAFPVGTSTIFRTFVGPADFNEAVNQLGQPYYAKVVEDRFGRGYDIHTQSNVLPLCMKPGVLVKLISSN